MSRVYQSMQKLLLKNRVIPITKMMEGERVVGYKRKSNGQSVWLDSPKSLTEEDKRVLRKFEDE